MLLWFMMNVVLPLLPIAIIGIFSLMLQWQSRLIDILSDGQLYFFSTSVCGVFTFDAIKSGKLEALHFVFILIFSLTLMSFYTMSISMAHSGKMLASGAGGSFKGSREARLLTRASVMASVCVVIGVTYLRATLELF